ncbi:MAG: cbb3-type cytochrome c oxidase subunit II [Acidimicrobiia bacterium]
MSELSAAAAAALGIPEAIVERSAAARAEETGMTVDEVLTAWAGGGEIPAAAAPPTPEEQAAEPEAAPVETPAAEEGVPPSPPPAVLPPSGGETGTPSPVPAPVADSGKPPVLVGEADNPIAVLVGVVAMFVAVFLVGLVGPALPAENPGARSSELPYSEAGLRGQHVYSSVGCASCHTQMVRPVVADVGLGAVTLNDSNQVLGSRRFGPDLSDVGSRISGSQIEGVIGGLGGHPSQSLSAEDLADIVAYLLESQTMEAAPAEPADEGDADEEEPAES